MGDESGQGLDDDVVDGGARQLFAHRQHDCMVLCKECGDGHLLYYMVGVGGAVVVLVVWLRPVVGIQRRAGQRG